MEQNLNNEFETDFYFFKLQYKEQKVENLSIFQKWYEIANNYIKDINKKNIPIEKKRIPFRLHPGAKLLTISFCNNCLSHVICIVETKLSLIRCTKCNKSLCPGCLRLYTDDDKGTYCLSGYFKLLYIRTINGRTWLESSSIIKNIIYILFFLILTPFYLGFISSFIGSSPHPNIKRKNLKKINESMCLLGIATLLIFFRALLMTIYVISFFPFLLIMLLPGIFSKKYFYRLMVMYLSALVPGNKPLKNLIE